MAKPNPQYPHGHQEEDITDESEYEEARRKLEKDKQKHLPPDHADKNPPLSEQSQAEQSKAEKKKQK